MTHVFNWRRILIFLLVISLLISSFYISESSKHIFYSNQNFIQQKENSIKKSMSNSRSENTSSSNYHQITSINTDKNYFIEQNGSTSVSYYFTYNDIIFVFDQSEIIIGNNQDSFKMKFDHANSVYPTGKNKLTGQSNFLLNTSTTTLNQYSQIMYPNLYDGIDLNFLIANNTLKYEFHVKPYYDPSIIQICMRALIRLESI